MSPTAFVIRSISEFALASQGGGFFSRIDPNMLGALLGSGVGILGGVIGTVAGICAPRGRAKTLVVGLFGALILVGLAALGFGVAAWSANAAAAVTWAFLMTGALATVLGGALLPVILARYREAEHRRLEAETFRAG